MAFARRLRTFPQPAARSGANFPRAGLGALASVLQSGQAGGGAMVVRVLSRVLLLLAALSVLGAVFYLVVRPSYLNWGATAEERSRRLPGDEIVPNAAIGETRAITINAAVADVWPWLAQTGQDRGGFYSFDLLENLVGCEMPTVDVLRTEKQVWQLGDKLWMYPPDGAGGAGFATLRSYVPGRVLGFGTRMIGTSLDEPENGSWTFVLEPVDARTTRLLIRGRGSARHSLLGHAFDRGIFEPIHFVMERRMMIGLKQIAETGSRGRGLNNVYIALWVITATLGLVAAVRVLTRPNWKRPFLALLVAAAAFQILTLGQPPLLIGLMLVTITGAAMVGPRPPGPEEVPRVNPALA